MPASMVEIPGLGNVEFPESMTPDQINTASKKLYDEHNAPKQGLLSKAGDVLSKAGEVGLSMAKRAVPFPGAVAAMGAPTSQLGQAASKDPGIFWNPLPTAVTDTFSQAVQGIDKYTGLGKDIEAAMAIAPFHGTPGVIRNATQYARARMPQAAAEINYEQLARRGAAQPQAAPQATPEPIPAAQPQAAPPQPLIKSAAAPTAAAAPADIAARTAQLKAENARLKQILSQQAKPATKPPIQAEALSPEGLPYESIATSPSGLRIATGQSPETTNAIFGMEDVLRKRGEDIGSIRQDAIRALPDDLTGLDRVQAFDKIYYEGLKRIVGKEVPSETVPRGGKQLTEATDYSRGVNEYEGSISQQISQEAQARQGPLGPEAQAALDKVNASPADISMTKTAKPGRGNMPTQEQMRQAVDFDLASRERELAPAAPPEAAVDKRPIFPGAELTPEARQQAQIEAFKRDLERAERAQAPDMAEAIQQETQQRTVARQAELIQNKKTATTPTHPDVQISLAEGKPIGVLERAGAEIVQPKEAAAGMTADDALKALGKQKLNDRPFRGGAPQGPFEAAAQDISQNLRDTVSALEGLNERAAFMIPQGENVATTGTIQPKAMRPEFRGMGPKPETYDFQISEKSIREGQARVVAVGRQVQDLLRNLQNRGSPLDQATAQLASERVQRAINEANKSADLFRKQRFAWGRAGHAYQRPVIPRDIIDSLREVGVVIDGLQAARQRLPIYTNILESLKKIDSLTPMEQKQLWSDFVDAFRLNLFSVTSWSLDFLGNAGELGAQSVSGLGRDLVHAAKGDLTFPSIQGAFRTVRERKPLTQDILSGLGQSVGGELTGGGISLMDMLRNRHGQGTPWGTFTKRETALSAGLDSLVGAPLYFKGAMDSGAKRLSASTTLWREAIEAADRRGIRGVAERRAFYDEFWRNPPEGAINQAVTEGNKAGFNRTLSRMEENIGRSVTARLLVDAFARWPFQFARWSGEMIGLDPAIFKAARNGTLTAEKLGGYLAKGATGIGGMMLIDNMLYDHVDFNSMEYMHPDGNRTRLSSRDPIPTALFFAALLHGDVDRATGALKYASIPFAHLLVGEGGLISSLISQTANAIKHSDVDPDAVKRETIDTINRAIPGQAMLSALKTLFDPTIREGVGANLPGVSLALPAAINPATGGPLQPRQSILGLEGPSIGGTPIPGARRELDPTTKLLSKYGGMVYRGPRQPIAGYPAGEVPEEIGRDWKVAFGKERSAKIERVRPIIERIEQANPGALNPGGKGYEQIHSLIQRMDAASSRKATHEINREQGSSGKKLKRRPQIRERRGPVENLALEGE